MRKQMGTGFFTVVLGFLGLTSSLGALSSADESKTVTTLASVPLGNLFNDNSYTPVASYRGTTYFVWINSDNRPKVGMIRNGVLSSSYLSPISSYTIRNDGHHYFSLGVDKAGYLHVTGDMHNYPTGDMSYYPTEYKSKHIMYWVSQDPESIASFDFVGDEAARSMPGYGFTYHSFQYDQDRELYFISRTKVHKGGHVAGEMGLGLYRYNISTRAWTALGGLAPSSPAAIFKSIAWENNGHGDTGGWYQGFRSSARFDLDNRLHFSTSINNDSTKPNPTHVLYGRSDDKGLTFKRSDNSAVSAPLRVDAGANQGDIVAGPGTYDLFSSVAFNRTGAPLSGYSESLDHWTFSYRYRLPGSPWSSVFRDPLGTYIRAKYHLDANGIVTFVGPGGGFRRAADFNAAAYSGSVGSSSFVGLDELGLRENNDFIGLSKNGSQCDVLRLRLEPLLTPLASPWSLGNLGSVTAAMGGSFNGTIILGSTGGLAGASADSARFAWQSLSGDFDLKVRVMSLSWSTDTAQAGLMLRQDGAAGAKMAAALVSYSEGAKLIARGSDGAAATTQTKAGHTASEWLKLERRGSTVTAYRSDQGSAWQLIGSQSVPFSGSLQAGIFQASGSSSLAGRARFDNFNITALAPGSPVPTATRTRTPAASATFSPSASPTPSRTSSPLMSPTEILSATESATPSPSHTVSPLRSPTPTFTVAASKSVTLTRTTTRTFTRTATPLSSATRTPSPAPTVASSMEVFHQSSDAATANGPHHKVQLKNKGASSVSLANVEMRYWLDCDCGGEALQAFVDWAGFPSNGSTVAATIVPVAFSGSGQTHFLRIKFASGTLAAGATVEVQFRFNRAGWGNFAQGDDYSWALHPSLLSWNKVAAYSGGVKTWGLEPGGAAAARVEDPKDAEGKEMPLDTQLLIAPNPASNAALARLSLARGGQSRLFIYGLGGNLVSERGLGWLPAGMTELPLELGHLAPGLYFVVMDVKDEWQREQRVFKLAVQ